MPRVLILSFFLCAVPEVFAQELKYIEVDKPELLNPVAGGRDVIGVRIVELLFRGLVSQNKDGEWIAEMAEAIPDFQPGQQELVVKLRDGIHWPDGRSITAHDVAFSFSVYIDPKNGYGNREILEIFDSVEAVDDQTVRFVLARSDRQAISRLGFYLMPKHLLPGSFIPETHGFNQSPIGSGPYMIEEADLNSIRFKLNEHFYKQSPSIEQIHLIVNPADNIHTTMLFSGLVDLDPVVSPMDIPQFLANHQTDLVPYDSKQWFGFAYNCRNSILQFKEVRQAFTYIFKRREALAANFAGRGDLISGPYTNTSQFYNPEIMPYPPDEIKGSSMLDELGIIDEDGDNWREYNKEKVSLRMVLNKQLTDANKNVCQNFAQQLRAQGIEVQVIFQDYNTWYETVFFHHDYDITFISWKFDEASNIYPLFHRSQQEAGLYNITLFQNAEVDKLLENFRYTTDSAERTTLGQQLHQVLSEESPYTFLWTLEYNAGKRSDRIAKINIDPFYFFRTIDTWEMRSGLE